MSLVQNIGTSEDGSLLPMGAAGMLVLAAMIGGGVDASRAYKAKTRLQAACDAGVLAGRKAVGTAGFDEEAEAEAEAYFANNFNSATQGASGTAFTPASPDNGNTVAASASADVSTAVMQIFGFNSIPITVICSASMGVGNSDVTMVLDTTGSMGDRLTSGGDTKIEMLQEAMKNFYDTVQASVAGGNARIRYSFVPYSQSINVGRLIYDLSPSYLVDSWTIQSRVAVPVETSQTFDHWSDPVVTNDTGLSTESVTDDGDLNSSEYTTRNACTNGLPDNTVWTNSGGVTSDTDVSINSRGQRVTTIASRQRQIRTAYTCVERKKNGKNKQTYYVQYFTKYSRSKYEYRIETQDPVYTTVVKNQFNYRAHTYDVSSYKAFSPVVTQTGQSGSTVGTNVTSTWAGCIEERETTPAVSFNFNRNTNRITPVSAIDLDIDAEPDSDNDTKWAPMWPQVAYYHTSTHFG